ncbi:MULTISPECIES: hypothetical protein [unclassified Duganella]|uniref:hypothetical protein n=1 Tax=unclassified Duganella TaxID=2636909 RepID=UPI000B7CB2C0|nr:MULTISPECIES: hypothetical protein [unclassified Duganella]
MKLKLFSRRMAAHDSNATPADGAVHADQIQPSIVPAYMAATGLDVAVKRVMDKLDRIEALVDALPSSRSDSSAATAAGAQAVIS